MRKIKIRVLGFGFIILVFLFTFVISGCKKDSIGGFEPTYGPPLNASPLVVSYDEAAIEAGYRILNSGGNAFDAYVAVTVVENVVSYGYVTLAGLLSALIYQAGTNTIMSLDSGYNSVLDPDGEYDPSNPVLGKQVVVPGIIAGLESMLTRYGRLSLAEVLQPAIEIARDGFPISEWYALYIEYYGQLLRSTEYGRRTFFPNGIPLQPGDILKQPELAEFLTRLAEQGSSYMYNGEWATQCVETVREAGGLMTLEDLASYQPTWVEPWWISYRGYDICATSGRVMHSLWSLLALKTLEHTTIQPLGHFSASADALELVVRIARAVEEEYWIYDYHYLDNRDLVNSMLTLSYTDMIWAKVQAAANNRFAVTPPKNHTLCSIIVDGDSNVVSGKHSINSDYWGTGLFVQGILLNSSSTLTERYTGPGERRTQGAPNFFVFKDGAMMYTCGTFGSYNPHTAFQFLVNVIDYRLPVQQATDLPRFGGLVYEENPTGNYPKNLLDGRISQEIVNTLQNRGLFFSQKNYRIGIGCMVEFHPDGGPTYGWGR
jgi:gamma-glutamyltranspeptidase/glutathione hydrolase